MSNTFSNNPNFSKFVESSNKASRMAYHIWLIVGLIGFGPIILISHFLGLKQGKFAMVYGSALLMIFIVFIIMDMSNFAGLAVILWYIIGWAHIDEIFTKYNKIAESRIKEIDQSNQSSFDGNAEKGILNFRIFNNKSEGIKCFKNAISFPKGTPILAYLSAFNLLKFKEYYLADQFVKRTIQISPTEEMKNIARNLEHKIARRLPKQELQG